jgi:prevent-host-death family protein
MPGQDPKLVTQSLPVFIARTQFGQILERVSKSRQRFLVTKNGEATAVILGVEDFLEAVVKMPETLRALQKQATSKVVRVNSPSKTSKQKLLQYDRKRKSAGLYHRFPSSHTEVYEYIDDLGRAQKDCCTSLQSV